MDKTTQYTQAAEMMRHFEKLIYDSTPPYFAIIAPLLAIIFGFGSTDMKLQVVACIFGFVVSLVWWISVERLRRVFTIHLNKTIELEGPDGVYGNNKRLLNEDHFLKFTPRGTRIRSIIHLLGILIFVVLFFSRIGI